MSRSPFAALADALAAEVAADIQVVELFAESSGIAGSGAEAYIDLVRTNGAPGIRPERSSTSLGR